MKKIILLGFILLFACASIHAQDTSLYRGKSDLYLWSGNVLKQITLWKIDTVRVQYVYNGNLSEVLTDDVLGITTANYEITFDEQNHIVKKWYDLIIKSSGDTIKGFIVRLMISNNIEYTPAGGKSNKVTDYKTYVSNNTESNSLTENKTYVTNKVDSNKVRENKSYVTNKVDSTLVQSQPVEKNDYHPEAKMKRYPSAKNNIVNKDLIITTGNDSIYCTILHEDMIKIVYSIKRHGPDTRAVILKADVKKN